MAKAKKSKRNKSYSGISDHKLKGKTLVPGFADIPNMKLSSWRDERLPELLWACLLASCIDRPTALSTFRQVVNYIVEKIPEAPGKITHTGLSELEEHRQRDIISIITGTKENRQVLTSLLLFDSLPARDQWAHLLPSTGEIDVSPLLQGVARTLDHQSEQSTDCRWLRVMPFLLAGKLKMHDKEIIEELFYYPDRGDMRKVRPTIRSMEGGISSMEQETTPEWPQRFWDEALRKTECYLLPQGYSKSYLTAGTTLIRINEVYRGVCQHMKETTTTTAIDAKHDTTFGLTLYSLTILNELLRVGNSSAVLGREGLRILLECYITLGYLIRKNDESLWQTYRVYGAGQAKLAFIKLDELGQTPMYVDKNTLQQLANEDMWQEYLKIDLGHWNDADLRKLSIDAGMKDAYDKFYPWTSSFVHGHWGSVRDTVFEICGNPLHRLHRIPKEQPGMLPDVVPDACYLVDRTLELMSTVYPTFTLRVTVHS
jgi:hypothetical protein